MIKTINLEKKYVSKNDTVTAIKKLNIYCASGEIYCLLGSNGAGKTTTFRILSTLILPTSGEAYLKEVSVRTDAKKIRSFIGYVSTETKVDKYLTPREIAYYYGYLNGIDKNSIRKNIEYFSKILEMGDFLDKQTYKLSTGMIQKTTLLRALIHNPEILILDEPTSGLDIITGKAVIDYLKVLKNEGKSIIFSTHVLWEAEKIADKIGIIHNGNLYEEGTFEDLQKKYKTSSLEEIFFNSREMKND